jgi:Mg/Co/Ni transporter MgtE
MLDRLHNTLEKGTEAEVKVLLKKLHSSEIADILESLPQNLRDQLWKQKTLKQEKILFEVLVFLRKTKTSKPPE